MKRRIRLLPIVIFAATLALTLKVGSIWTAPHLEIAKATAAKSAAAESKDGAGKSAGAKATKHAKSDAPSPKGGNAKPSSGRQDKVGDEFDPSSVTQAEFHVLQQLAKRRGELDKRQRDLTLKEQVLSATEKRLNAKIEELNELKDLIEGLLKKHDEEQNRKLKSLVKIYETMKPKKAARIFEQLEMEILLDVVERMREAKTAPIFAAMDPTKAKDVTARLAERRQLPSPSSVTEGG